MTENPKSKDNLQGDAPQTQETAMNSTNSDKIRWHPAFVSALQLELRENRDDLTFQDEEPLSSEPLRLDVLVCSRDGSEIKNQIGRIFRKYNIFEYKSPDDGLTIDVFYKVYGYACIYKAQGKHLNARRADEITISLVRDAYPRELMAELQREGREISIPYPGIYYISGNFPTQIVVTSQLAGPEHIWLKALCRNLEIGQYMALLKDAAQSSDKGSRMLADTALDVIYKANSEQINRWEESDSMFAHLEELMKPELDAKFNAGWQKGQQEGRQEGWQKGQQEGWQKGQQEGWQNKSKAVTLVLQDMGFSAEQIATVVDADVATVQSWLN